MARKKAKIGPGGEVKTPAGSDSKTRKRGAKKISTSSEAEKPVPAPIPEKREVKRVRERVVIQRESSRYISWMLEKFSAALFLAFTGFIIVVMLSAPAMRMFPSLAPHMFFLNHVPPFILMDFSNLTAIGLKGDQLAIESKGISIGAWDVAPIENDQNTIILYCHGTSGHRGQDHRVQLYRKLSESGYRTLAFDYRGYGDSTNVQPWSEDDLVADVLAVDKWIRMKYSATNPRIVYWGHSMGSGSCSKAAYLSEQAGRKVDALIMEGE